MNNLKEKYEKIIIPDSMFKINYETFNKNIMCSRLIIASVILLIIINICMIITEFNLQRDINNISTNILKIEQS